MGDEISSVLAHLSIREFAVLKRLDLDFGPGLNVLTGETGAGKSITLDALQAALGERLSTDVLAAAADKALVEAAFDLGNNNRLVEAIAELGFEPEDGLLILSREIAPGQTRCRVNGRMVTLSALQELGTLLVDFHGQHEHQSLLKPASYRRYLDLLLPPEALELREQYSEAWARLQALGEEVESLQTSSRERAQRLDTLGFQVKEIRDANLKLGELEELNSRKSKARHFEKLREATALAWSLLEGDEEAGQALPKIEQAAQELLKAAEWDETLGPLAELVANSAMQLQEATSTVSLYLEELEFDPKELDRLEARLAFLELLQRKYGDTIEAILEYAARAEAELAKLETSAERLAELAAELARAESETFILGEKLASHYHEVGDQLAAAVEERLARLNMKGARFAAGFTPARSGLLVQGPAGPVRLARKGLEEVEFILATDGSGSLKPLTQIASGGEMSRVMLAIKASCAGGEVPVMVFDEIDSGVGGETAHRVADQLEELAHRRQLLVVTHLAQLAARADRHLVVEKEAGLFDQPVVARPVADEARVEEVARMLSGSPESDSALAHAAELLKAKGAAR